MIEQKIMKNNEKIAREKIVNMSTIKENERKTWKAKHSRILNMTTVAWENTNYDDRIMEEQWEQKLKTAVTHDNISMEEEKNMILVPW